MPSRRGGKKSHHGCANCKRRHLKCDEVSPTCGRCQKRGEVCVRTYSPFRNVATITETPFKARMSRISAVTQKWDNYAAYTTSSAASDASREATPTSTTIHSEHNHVTLPYICSSLAESAVHPPNAPLSGDGECLDDMLFKHYLSVVSWTLNEDARVVQLYQELVPELAVKHAQIRHAVLAISGAHCVAALTRQNESGLADARTIQTLVERTLNHNSMALSTFAKQISMLQQTDTISHDECVLATMASIMILTTFIAQLHPALQDYSHEAPSSIDKAVALLNLEGPIAGFFCRYGQQLSSTKLRVYFDDYMPQVADGAVTIPAEVEEGLERVAELCATVPDAALFSKAIEGLRQKYRIVALHPTTIGGRFGWMTGDDAAAIANIIHRRRPEALVLLAYWAACFIPWSMWWGNDFARRLIVEIDHDLPTEYSSYMAWPRSRLEH